MAGLLLMNMGEKVMCVCWCVCVGTLCVHVHAKCGMHCFVHVDVCAHVLAAA